MMIRTDNNRNPMSKHRYTMNQTRMPLFRICCELQYLPVPSLKLATSSRTIAISDPASLIFTNRLWQDPSRRNTSDPQSLPNDGYIPCTFIAKPCPAALRRRDHSVCSGMGWTKIVLVRRTSESCSRTWNCHIWSSVLGLYFASWIRHAPI
jgi:hypothetical protein